MTTAIISAHYVPFAIDRGASPGTAALAFGLMTGLNVLGVIGVGIVSDRLGRKNLLAGIYAVRGVAYAMLILAPGTLGIWGFAFIAGFSWIATAPLTSSLTADIYGLRTMGTLNGMSTFAHQMGGALSILMGGLLYDVFGAYDVPFAHRGRNAYRRQPRKPEHPREEVLEPLPAGAVPSARLPTRRRRRLGAAGRASTLRSGAPRRARRPCPIRLDQAPDRLDTWAGTRSHRNRAGACNRAHSPCHRHRLHGATHEAEAVLGQRHAGDPPSASPSRSLE